MVISVAALALRRALALSFLFLTVLLLGVYSALAAALPYGNVPPPAGTHWHLIFNDTFSKDTGINTSLWNAGPDGYPLCHTPCVTSANDNVTGCGWAPYAPSSCIQDCLGYAGGQQGNECQDVFSGTDFVTGQPFYNKIVPGIGLEVLSANDPSDPTGLNNYFDSTWTGLQNSGKMTITPNSYVEWWARMPTDVHGEGDGFHTDLWCTPNDRAYLTTAEGTEVDVNERIASTTNRQWTSGVAWDGSYHSYTQTIYGASNGANLDNAFHHYAGYWRNDGSGTYGSWQIYMDAVPVSGAYAISNPTWKDGAYCFGGWMQQANYGYPYGPSSLTPSTANNPLKVRYFRAWQAY
jgi:hypothetical protein